MFTSRRAPLSNCQKRTSSSPRRSREGGLTVLRRPTVGLAAGAAHQHRPLGVAEAIGFQKRLDRLLVIDDGERAGPVGAPQAAIETPGIEDAGKRVPNVREGIWLLR